MADAAKRRAKAFRVLGLTTDTNGKQGTPMKTITAGDNLAFIHPKLIMRPASGQLERRLIGLSAGVGKKHLIGKSGCNQLVGQTQCRLIGHNVGYMPQAISLLSQRFDHSRMTVPQSIDRNTTSQVNIFSALLVPQARTCATHGHHVHWRIIGHHNPIKIRPTDFC